MVEVLILVLVLDLLGVEVADDVKLEGVSVGLQGTVISVVLVMVIGVMLEVDSADKIALSEDST